MLGAAACGAGDDGLRDAAAPADAPGLTHEQIRIAAIFWGSCVPDDRIASFLRGVYEQRNTPGFDTEAIVECLASKRNGCAAIRDCAGIRLESDGPCEKSCSGGTYSVCDDAWHFTMDCEERGLACDPDEGCVDPSAELCDVETFQASCEGGAPVACDGRVRKGPVCADWGLACGSPYGNDSFACHGTGEACESSGGGPFHIRYDGLACRDDDTLEACVGGRIAEIDCARMGPGLTCQRVPSSAIDCSDGGSNPPCDGDTPRDTFICGRGSECIEERTITCEGAKVVFCDMGKRETFDCRALGFDGCTEPFGCVPNGHRRVNTN